MQIRVLAAVAGLFFSALVVAPPAPAHAQTQCGGQINDACLSDMLTNMGYAPKKLSAGYLIVVKHGTWDMNVQLVISPGGHKIGMNANLGDLNGTGITAENYKAILAKNGDIDPSTFYVNPTTNRLLLHRVMDNREVSPAVLRIELDAFLNDIESTNPVWQGVTH